MAHVTKQLAFKMDTCHKIKHCHLVAHIIAYVICCRNTYGQKCIYISYIHVKYHMSHATYKLVATCLMQLCQMQMHVAWVIEIQLQILVAKLGFSFSGCK